MDRRPFRLESRAIPPDGFSTKHVDLILLTGHPPGILFVHPF